MLFSICDCFGVCFEITTCFGTRFIDGLIVLIVCVCRKAKLYRFDKEGNQWKERGGDGEGDIVH
jgi:hypothetical protein